MTLVSLLFSLLLLHVQLEGDAALCLGVALRVALPSLTDLAVEGIADPRGLLISSLQARPLATLRSLSLRRGSALQPEHLHNLALSTRAGGTLAGLTDLQLTGCRVGLDGLAHLSRQLRQGACRQLRALRLLDTATAASGYEDVLGALAFSKACPHLAVLQLGSTRQEWEKQEVATDVEALALILRGQVGGH